MSEELKQLEERIQKSSKTAAKITGVAGILIIAALIVGLFQLFQLDRSVQDKKEEIAALDKSLEVRREQVDAMKMEFRDMEKEASKSGNIPLQTILKKRTPIIALVVPQAKEKLIREPKVSQLSPMKNYLLWLEIPSERISEIQRVRYLLNDPAFKGQSLESNTPENGFSIDFQWRECLEHVIITLILQDQSEVNLDFDMCRALGIKKEKRLDMRMRSLK
ncbi:MAG: hypothetical protein HY800_05720 [Ignavibacteriales bacterium]|nr:hypothetical protein [Ignavibacteriales bacterium]